MYDDAPQDLVHDLIAEAIFGDHPLGRPVIGTAEVISSIPREAIAGYHGAMYTPQASTRSSSPDVARYGLFPDRTCRAEASGEGGLRARPRVTPMMRLFSASAIINSGSAAARNACADVYRITLILLSE